MTPHRHRALLGVRISLIAAGSTAVHAAVVSEAGALYTWGRNDNGEVRVEGWRPPKPGARR